MSGIESFFAHQLMVKMFHFQTAFIGSHTAADAYLLKFQANLDRFMEVWQGREGRLKDFQITINFTTATDETITYYLETFDSYLRDLQVEGQNLQSDLANIRDEMRADLQQFRYLLTFR